MASRIVDIAYMRDPGYWLLCDAGWIYHLCRVRAREQCGLTPQRESIDSEKLLLKCGRHHFRQGFKWLFDEYKATWKESAGIEEYRAVYEAWFRVFQITLEGREFLEQRKDHSRQLSDQKASETVGTLCASNIGEYPSISTENSTSVDSLSSCLSKSGRATIDSVPEENQTQHPQRVENHTNSPLLFHPRPVRRLWDLFITNPENRPSPVSAASYEAASNAHSTDLSLEHSPRHARVISPTDMMLLGREQRRILLDQSAQPLPACCSSPSVALMATASNNEADSPLDDHLPSTALMGISSSADASPQRSNRRRDSNESRMLESFDSAYLGLRGGYTKTMARLSTGPATLDELLDWCLEKLDASKPYGYHVDQLSEHGQALFTLDMGALDDVDAPLTEDIDLDTALGRAICSDAREAWLDKTIHAHRALLPQLHPLIEARLADLGQPLVDAKEMNLTEKLDLLAQARFPKKLEEPVFMIHLNILTDDNTSSEPSQHFLNFPYSKMSFVYFQCILRNFTGLCARRTGRESGYTLLDGPWKYQLVGKDNTTIGGLEDLADENTFNLLIRQLKEEKTSHASVWHEITWKEMQERKAAKAEQYKTWIDGMSFEEAEWQTRMMEDFARDRANRNGSPLDEDGTPYFDEKIDWVQFGPLRVDGDTGLEEQEEEP
ncbi:MAG: hypothetical protein M1817_004538 [Caeruleum heppii]|nr:MAG: hypothetical protein M1817_004538 [Caeruleum heppii]